MAVRALTQDVGPDTAVVPTVVGLSRTTAEARVRAAGFVARVERGRPGNRRDVVMRQDPPPGAVRPRGTGVALVVPAARVVG